MIFNQLYDFVSPPVFGGKVWDGKNAFTKLVEKGVSKTTQFRYI